MMRFFHAFTALSAGLLASTLTSHALASEAGFVARAGSFSYGSLVAGRRASVRAIEQAAPAIAQAQLRYKSSVSFAAPFTQTLGSGERVVKLLQTYQGVPVVQRGVAVTFEDDGRATLVTARLEEDLPASVTPQITAAQAAIVATESAGLSANPSRALLVLFPTADGTKLAWLFDAAPVLGLPYLPVTVVDAQSGEIILRYNAIHTLHEAKVYASNPTKAPKLIDVTLPVEGDKPTLANARIKSFNCIDTKETVTLPFQIPGSTESPKVHTCRLRQTAQADAEGNYTSIAPGGDTEPEDAFSEVSMFYHANRAYDFFRSFDPKFQVEPSGVLPTISNLRMPQGFNNFDLQKLGDVNLPLVPFQNAFFAPKDQTFSLVFPEIKGGAMWFGQGPVRDYSYDGDVVYHEFTHAVVNATLKLVGTPHIDEYGAVFSPGGMNEGLADYFAAAISGDPDVGEYASGDISPGMKAIRSLANPDACPTDIGGEVHQDATMFSGALWDVRKTLDNAQQAALDKAVFSAMNKSATGDLGYEDFIALILPEVTAAEGLGAPVKTALEAAFTARGLLPKCSRVLEYKGEEMSGPEPLSGLWITPGKSTAGAKLPQGAAPGVIQFHWKLPARTDGAHMLTMRFKGRSLGGGGGSPFGGGGSPFTPKVLLRFGAEPIKFTLKPLKAPADVIFAPTTSEGSGQGALAYEASVNLPENATEAYVMIVNAGDGDGAYTQFSLDVEAGTTEPTGAGGAGGGGGAGGAGGMSSGSTGGTTKPTNNATPAEAGGCGCAVPGDASSNASAFVALAALGLLASRRRRG